MAVGFEKPHFEVAYDLDQEKANFDRFFTDPVRAIPPKGPNELDLASWNIDNLGLQSRGDKELALIANILSHFDVIAVQEINEILDHFRAIMGLLEPLGYDTMITDASGSQERLGVVYRTDRVRPGQLFGELDYNPNGKVIDGQYVIEPRSQTFTVDGKKFETLFYNFNRNPFLTTWRVLNSAVHFMLATAHLYFGDEGDDNPKFRNRLAEAYFFAKWASDQRKKGDARLYERNIILLGDMNVPRMESSDPVFRALLRQGMQPTQFSTQAGTTIQEFNTYDQIIFTKETASVIAIKDQVAIVVDYDNFMFPALWAQVQAGTRTLTDFKAWCRFAISDHRPLFVRLAV